MHLCSMDLNNICYDSTSYIMQSKGHELKVQTVTWISAIPVQAGMGGLLNGPNCRPAANDSKEMQNDKGTQNAYKEIQISSKDT